MKLRGVNKNTVPIATTDVSEILWETILKGLPFICDSLRGMVCRIYWNYTPRPPSNFCTSGYLSGQEATLWFILDVVSTYHWYKFPFKQLIPNNIPQLTFRNLHFILLSQMSACLIMIPFSSHINFIMYHPFHIISFHHHPVTPIKSSDSFQFEIEKPSRNQKQV